MDLTLLVEICLTIHGHAFNLGFQFQLRLAATLNEFEWEFLEGQSKSSMDYPNNPANWVYYTKYSENIKSSVFNNYGMEIIELLIVWN